MSDPKVYVGESKMPLYGWGSDLVRDVAGQIQQAVDNHQVVKLASGRFDIFDMDRPVHLRSGTWLIGGHDDE